MVRLYSALYIQLRECRTKITPHAMSCSVLAADGLADCSSLTMSECASGFWLGMTHTWPEPEPLFPAICPSLSWTQSQLNHHSTKIVSFVKWRQWDQTWQPGARDAQVLQGAITNIQHTTEEWITNEQEVRESKCFSETDGVKEVRKKERDCEGPC